MNANKDWHMSGSAWWSEWSAERSLVTDERNHGL